MQTATPIKQFFFILLFMILCGMQAVAQSGNVLFGEVEAAKQRGAQFTEYNLFRYAGPATMLDGGSLLAPQALQIATLYNEKPSAITVQIPSSTGSYTLSMLRGSVFTGDMQALVADSEGPHTTTIDKGVHYTGCIEGQTSTLATMSIFANGDVMILFANKDGNYVVGQLQDKSGGYIFYRDDAIKGLPPYECKFKDGNTPQQTGDKTTAIKGTCKVIRVYLEADYDLFVKFSKNKTQTQNYLTGIFNQIRGLYKNDSMIVMLSSTKLWITPDNYKDSSSDMAIVDFIDKWNVQKDTFNGDLAVLVAKDIRNNGGIAPLRTLCTKSNSYAYADIEGTYQNIPIYSKDVMVISHEVGHLLGSMHTHWCGWNTGPANTCGAIDDCTTLEVGSGCGTCPVTNSNSAPTSAWSGTIMSYCHTKARGINLANGFGPLPGKEMRSSINDPVINTCLEGAIKATLQVDNICRGYGAITVLFDTTYVNNQTLPPSSLLFYWTTGATTQNLSYINTPGTYGVSITDANGNCHIQYNTSVVLTNTDSCRFKTNIENTTVPLQFSISPNPSNGYCNVVHNSATKMPYSIVITDMQGRVMQQTDNIRDSNYRIVTAGYPQAVYTVLVRTANGSQHLRLVVQ